MGFAREHKLLPFAQNKSSLSSNVLFPAPGICSLAGEGLAHSLS